jgi:pimeloyl-ACP methyl ester carboxylesterase
LKLAEGVLAVRSRSNAIRKGDELTDRVLGAFLRIACRSRRKREPSWYPARPATFRHILPELTDAFICHLVDLPGTGRTTWRDGAPVSFLNHPKVVRRAIDALGLKRYALLAHDSGGFVARHVAAEDDRVTGMVLGNTEISWHRPWLVFAYAWLLKAPGGLALLMTIMRSRAMRRSHLGLGGCFADLAWLDGDFHELFVRPLLESRAAAEGPATPMRLPVPGFMRFEQALKPKIEVADERPAPVRLVFYAQNSFRIFVADLVLQFCRHIPAPPEIAVGERALREAVLRLDPFRLRRWVLTNERWDDDENARVEVLAEGTDSRTLDARY